MTARAQAAEEGRRNDAAAAPLATDLVLVFHATAGVRAALPASHVLETMRPLSIEPLAGAPDFVAGVAVVRGRPTPVVDAAALLGVRGGAAPARWVTLRTGDRIVALAVAGVVGVRRLSDSLSAASAPPLLRGVAQGAVRSLGVLDGDLFLVLQTARLMEDDVWLALGEGAAAPARRGAP